MALQGNGPALINNGSYTLKSIVEDIPLSESNEVEIRITCVELWENSLYVGTSGAEVLHYVAIPSDSPGDSQSPTFIFASRLQPIAVKPIPDVLAGNGIQQILILPSIGKACILCTGTLSFYTLPELSPAFGNLFVANCTWVGGIDLSSTDLQVGESVVIMICIQKRVRLVQIGEIVKPVLVRNIEFPNCLATARRNEFACVADFENYALLDVEKQRKIPLFPISSLTENLGNGKTEDISSPPNRSNRSSLSLRPVSREENSDIKGHGRNKSLGAIVGGLARRQGSPQPKGQERAALTPEPLDSPIFPPRTSSRNRSFSTTGSPSRPSTSQEKPLPLPPDRPTTPKEAASVSAKAPALVPHICSPTSSEFLLTTGTDASEPGVGIVVNLEGDVVRGTLEFARYPNGVVVDGGDISAATALSDTGQTDDAYVLATMTSPETGHGDGVIEIQKWDGDIAEKQWLPIPVSAAMNGAQHQARASIPAYGIGDLHTTIPITFPEVGAKLRARRLRLALYNDGNVDDQTTENDKAMNERERKRQQEETDFGRRLGQLSSHIAVWSGATIWWAVRNPLVLRLDDAIDRIIDTCKREESQIDRERLIIVINDIRGQEAATETDFLSFEYLRQKASLILFADLATRSRASTILDGAGVRITEALLMEGGIDPRVILPTIPFFEDDIVEGQKGIWLHAGLLNIIEKRPWLQSSPQSARPLDGKSLYSSELADLLKRYLTAWRKRKGFGSIADEAEVFQTVDAALLHVLLHQDRPHPSRAPSVRAELYNIVDSGVDCFDRAVSLLEEYHRLYVLSRLYQQGKMARKVLSTWKRIIQGERDDGGELNEGENEVRKYLVRTRDRTLVEEYGMWLARRNAQLGVQVFTDDNRRVRLDPQEVVHMLRQQAPDAVKVYLEHLVFGKKAFQYANDLISYYLDSVLATLEKSVEARMILSQSYVSYRALHPPKPTYRQFIIENSLPQAWWQDRLRLLELLGGSHGADFSYDVAGILARIEPFEKELVPESIIIDGRQGRHQQAISLLVHGLGDYHTAINYCLLGGASIYHPVTGSIVLAQAQSRDEQVILFGYLLSEFLNIEDFNVRLERTSELLERFGSWYDVSKVLDIIPESWSVDLVSGFLVGAFRRLVTEKNEAVIVKSLSGSENLRVASEFIEKCTSMGPHLGKLE